MVSSFLYVIVIGTVFQVFAQWKVQHYFLEETTTTEGTTPAPATVRAVTPYTYLNDRFHSQLWWMNLQKINEENKKKNLKELPNYMVSDVLANELLPLPPPPPPSPPPTLKTPDKTKATSVCTNKIKVDSDTVSRIKAGNWRIYDPMAKPWVKCVLMENKLMTEQSVFRQDVAFKFFAGLERQKLEENIDKCLPKTATPPLEISWTFAKCFKAAYPDPENSLF